ncbi:Thioredoxin domain [Trinorchestia longiramus]|nr:Thioredoxin domain [Trinorchestia longiramus]
MRECEGTDIPVPCTKTVPSCTRAVLSCTRAVPSCTRAVQSCTMTLVRQWAVLLLLVVAACTVTAKKDDLIQDVNAKQLDDLMDESDYVAVYWYKRSCPPCDKVLAELEDIDDDTARFGVHFVKVADKKLARSHGVKTFPALTYFRNSEPIHYEGDLMDEGSVLEFLTSLEAMELPEQIEEVNAKILDKVVEEQEYVAVLFYKSDCKKCVKVLAELENIDDDADQLGIAFVKLNDPDLADEYSLGALPALVYYRRRIPVVFDGDLMNEDKVLEWLLENKSTGDEDDVIEEVTAGLLNSLIDSMDTLAVVFYDRDEADDIEILEQLEDVDDELDNEGIHIVKICDESAAKEYGIEKTPALVYFEHEIPSLYDGDLSNEEEVLEWLVEQLNTDEIEDVTDEMLDKLIADSSHLAVLFYNENEAESDLVLSELENIDDECDSHGITFVKIDDDNEAREYGLDIVPKLVYFEKSVPSIYVGSLLKEEEVLAWLVHQVSNDEIEDVTDQMLDKLINKAEHLAVLFYDREQRKSKKVLAELETIDDECDTKDIMFVKINDPDEAKEYGLDTIPALVYFESEIPYIYEGDLMKEEEVLKWLFHHVEEEEIAEVTDEMLDKLIASEPFLAVLFYDKSDDEDHEILEELENIDDDCEQAGIPFIKMADAKEAKEYGIDELPTLVYFENRIPSIFEGELSDEHGVLTWLLKQRSSDTIEEVTDEILDDLIANFEYVAVYFSGECDEGQRCDNILSELENIDDETDDHGMHFVTTEETDLAQQHGITEFPALVLFRNGEVLEYEGDLKDEQKILGWLTDEDTLEIPNKIEEVNERMLERLLNVSSNLAVFYYDEADKASRKILVELENIDDECDDVGIDFVKISDEGAAARQDLTNLPVLVFYSNRFPQVYEGNLLNEEALLEWLLDNKDKGPAAKHEDTIENINRQLLYSLIDTQDYLAVYFFNDENEECPKVLRTLEKIDDEAADFGVHLVKMNDRLMAKKYGFRNPPGLVYFRKGKHIKYEGDLYDEEDVLDWLTSPENMELNDAIEKVNRKMFERIKEATDYLAVFFYTEVGCKQCQKVLAELENIDDEADANGINFVKLDDFELAKEVGVYALPAIVFYRAGTDQPVIYAGDLRNEEAILNWLLTEKNPAADFIEDLDGDTLLKVIRDSDAVAVYFYSEDDSKCKNCSAVLAKLENIDDDTDRLGVKFVKTQEGAMADKYGVGALPALLYFEHQIPTVFDGDLLAEEEVLQWLVLQKTEDRIETVNRNMLEVMLSDTQYLAVFFYKPACKACDLVLSELENIDDECDAYGIHMVKIQDPQLAKRYGIKTLPALIYFRNGNPLIFEGDISIKSSVYDWLIDEDNRELSGAVESVNRNMLLKMIDSNPFVAVIFTSDLNSGAYLLSWLADEENRELVDEIEHVNQAMLDQLLERSIYLAALFCDARNEDSLLEWLIDEDSRELVGEIESINTKMLKKLLDDTPFIAVFFCK